MCAVCCQSRRGHAHSAGPSPVRPFTNGILTCANARLKDLYIYIYVYNSISSHLPLPMTKLEGLSKRLHRQTWLKLWAVCSDSESHFGYSWCLILLLGGTVNDVGWRQCTTHYFQTTKWRRAWQAEQAKRGKTLHQQTRCNSVSRRWITHFHLPVLWMVLLVASYFICYCNNTSVENTVSSWWISISTDNCQGGEWNGHLPVTVPCISKELRALPPQQTALSARHFGVLLELDRIINP